MNIGVHFELCGGVLLNVDPVDPTHSLKTVFGLYHVLRYVLLLTVD